MAEGPEFSAFSILTWQEACCGLVPGLPWSLTVCVGRHWLVPLASASSQEEVLRRAQLALYPGVSAVEKCFVKSLEEEDKVQSHLPVVTFLPVYKVGLNGARLRERSLLGMWPLRGVRAGVKWVEMPTSCAHRPR